MIAAIPSAVLVGVDGKPVSVEVHVSNGLPGFTVVGLPDAAVRESRDRVRAALLSSGFLWPARRVTVNLAPSGMKKGGAGLDLPIAIGLLVASGSLDPDSVAAMAFVGELGLDGSVRSVPGTVVLAEALHRYCLVVAQESRAEAELAGTREVRGGATLRTLVACITGRHPWPTRALVPDGSGPSVPRGDESTDASYECPNGMRRDGERPDGERSGGEFGGGEFGGGECREEPPVRSGPDLSDVRGQRLARRALEVAAAGGHHMLMVGPPGSGKSMLATRLPGILPPLDRPTALAVTRIHSVAGLPLPKEELIRLPPFRAPHHGTSTVAMIGGGTAGMRPGEISFAHGGVLFLDELGEFPTIVLDALRQPLEEGQVRVSRSRGSACFPARFILVAAMNPCPCGEGGPPGTCRCSEAARERYARRLSGPLLDRFDIAIRVDRPDVDELMSGRHAEPSVSVANRVAEARRRAALRRISLNASVPASELDEKMPITADAAALIEQRVRSGSLSARGLHRVRRLARTIADLGEEGSVVEAAHVREALLLRARRDFLLGADHR